MKIQVLVATMNQNDHQLLKKMNINTDAIIGNQCNYNSIEKFDYKGNNIEIQFTFDYRVFGGSSR